MELIHSMDLHLSLQKMEGSEYPSRYQTNPLKQQIVLSFLFVKGLGYRATHRELCSLLGERTD
jgi:hypothetical protein